MKRGTWILVGTLALLVVGCATAPDGRRNIERGPDRVLGEPPEEGSEDFEVAPPPRHPGPHGEVSVSNSERFDGEVREPGVFRRSEIGRLLEFGPAVVLEHVDTEPSYEEGRFLGFMIVDFSDQAQSYVSPELRVGDVITHLNLVRVERPDHYLEVWNQLGEAEEIRIDFLRDGEALHQSWRVR